MVLVTMCNHVADVPKSIRRVASILTRAVTARFAPDSNTPDECVLIASGGASAASLWRRLLTLSRTGLFFLRFMSPAFALACGTAPTHAQNTLKHIAKMLQALISTIPLKQVGSQ